MPSIYKCKVYEGSTANFADATFIQDLLVTLLGNDEIISGLPTSGSNIVINSDGSHGSYYDVINNAGLLNFCIPVVGDSSFPGVEAILTQTAQYFPNVYSFFIDTKGKSALQINVYRHLFITTDNSDYYIHARYETYIYNSNYQFNLGSLSLNNKNSGATVSGYNTSIGKIDREYSSSALFTTMILYPPSKNGSTSNGYFRVSAVTTSNKLVYVGGSTSLSNSSFYAMLANDEPYVEDTDPYAGAGDSETGGGDGTFDGSSDPVPVPPLPTVGATDAGFITLYAPTTTQLKNLAYTCWVGLLDDVWTNFRKLFSDPMDCILGLSVVPVSVPTSGVQDVAIGNIPTGVSMNVASQQYIEVDCGTVSFTKQSMNWHFGSYLDYEPYTKIAIYLPYIGVHQLNTDDIMGRTIQVVYHIDILTGSCIAFVKCGDSVLYQFNGACASNIPVNSLNYASTIENAIRIAVNIGTTVATAGASAPLSAGVEGANAGLKTAQNVARGVSMAGATAEGALSMKPSIGRSGSLGGTTGLMGTQYPYMIITRPKLCKPKNQDFYKGYPSFIQTTIGDLLGKGYTEFDTVIISTLYLTDDEETELETILKGGVYL